jgi:DNA repair protein RecO
MSHALYTTDAFVISSRDTSEADKTIILYTREIGLVKAVAKGIRYGKSKLRYSLYRYAYVRVVLVRGREVWRITGAAEIEPTLAFKNPAKLGLAAEFFELFSRFVQGEEPDAELFDEILFIRNMLRETPPESTLLEQVSLLGSVRLLYRLGYLGMTQDVEYVAGAPVSTSQMLGFIKARRGALLPLVNRALSQSHL